MPNSESKKASMTVYVEELRKTVHGSVEVKATNGGPDGPPLVFWRCTDKAPALGAPVRISLEWEVWGP